MPSGKEERACNLPSILADLEPAHLDKVRKFQMSFNGFVVNLINDLKVTINLGGSRKGRRPSVVRTMRGFVAMGLLVCLILVVIGFAMTGATSGIENPHPIIESMYTSIIGTGIGAAIPLIVVFILMGGANR